MYQLMFCEGGMLAITHILNGRRTKATHNRVDSDAFAAEESD